MTGDARVRFWLNLEVRFPEALNFGSAADVTRTAVCRVRQLRRRLSRSEHHTKILAVPGTAEEGVVDGANDGPSLVHAELGR
jgi:hypothetical protein